MPSNETARTFITAEIDSEVNQYATYGCRDMDATDNIIAYLYEQAERPEVVLAMEQSLHSESRYWQDNFVAGMWEDDAKMHIDTLLTALIGPRPTAKERDDE